MYGAKEFLLGILSIVAVIVGLIIAILIIAWVGIWLAHFIGPVIPLPPEYA